MHSSRRPEINSLQLVNKAGILKTVLSLQRWCKPRRWNGASATLHKSCTWYSTDCGCGARLRLSLALGATFIDSIIFWSISLILDSWIWADPAGFSCTASPSCLFPGRMLWVQNMRCLRPLPQHVYSLCTHGSACARPNLGSPTRLLSPYLVWGCGGNSFSHAQQTAAVRPCQCIWMDPILLIIPKSKFCLLSAIAVMKVAPFNLKQKSRLVKSAGCFVTRLQHERKQHGESMRPIWRPTSTPVAVAPLSEEKTRDIVFTFKVGWRHIRMLFVSNRRCSLLHLSRDTCGSLRRCSRYCNYFYLFIFLCAAAISGYTVQMNLRLPLWSIMQCHFFRGPADEIFGFIWLNYGNYFFFFFCPKGNAVLLIKPGSELMLPLSVEKQSKAMEPSKCQRIIMK